MYYVVIDLEWNQYHNPLRTPTSRSGVKMHEEIIQIGAIKTDHQMNPVDTFRMFIRLGGGRRLDKYVKKLTHISDADIASGEDFVSAAPQFAEWLKDVDAVFSWGPDDRRVYLNNLAFFDLPAPSCAWYDAQKIYASQVPEHGPLALKTVAESMQVHVNLSLHDAMNDAILTAFCMYRLNVEAGVEAYNKQKETAASGDTLQMKPLFTCKTHRHMNQQAAWEEACNGLLRCPQCMQPLSWSGDEIGTLTRFYKPAKCDTHGEYLIRGEFGGSKMCTVKFSFFPATPEILELAKKEMQPAAKKHRRRRRRKPAVPAAAPATEAAETVVSIAPEELLPRAIAFAAEAHRQQARGTGAAARIVHPMEVVSVAATMTDDPALLAAAALHDTLETCPGLTAEAIEKTFGAHVADLVSFETEIADPETGWRERRQAELDRLKGADEEQLILALSDRLSDARALSREYAALKDELWQRFNQADRREQAWYYKALVVAFKPLERFGAYGEFKHLISSVFARRRAAKSAPEENNG